MSESERDHIRGCHLSRRRLEEDDILRVSRRFGAGGWRDVGNSLHFTHAQLDQVQFPLPGPVFGIDVAREIERN